MQRGNCNITEEEPGKVHLNEMVKVNIISNQMSTSYHALHQEHHITSVVFLPKIHSPDFIMENMRQTQVEVQSTK